MTENTDNDQEARLQAIRDKGARDFYVMKGVLLNSYPRGTPEHNEYERGWVQAQRRSGVVFNDSPSDNWRYVPEPKPYEPPKVNEYARRKG